MNNSIFRKRGFWFLSLMELFLLSCTSSNKYFVINADKESQKIYNLPYGLDPRHKMDVYLPPNHRQLPMVILVHGGAWKYGDKSHMRQIQQMLFLKDIPSAAINYRLVSKNTTYHQQLQDLDLALNKLKKESENGLFSPNQFILLGESAGGHLALLYGYHHPEEILKIIALSAPTDFFSQQFLQSTYSTYVLPTIEKLVGEKMNRKNPSKAFENASPIAQVSSVPTLIFQGGKDWLVSKKQGFALDSVLSEKKIPHRFIFMKNAGHVPRLHNQNLRDTVIYPEIVHWILNNSWEQNAN
ncbi:MAG: alpha/beta hydrolase [Bacteroidetes bacterium]|nr:alpha/beta hydrolase [Bacteroidota bacterium]